MEVIRKSIYLCTVQMYFSNSHQLKGDLNDIWQSSDEGTNWDLVTSSAPWSIRFSHSSVVLNNNIILMGGSAHVSTSKISSF